VNETASPSNDDDQLVRDMDAVHACVSNAYLDLFELIVRAERAEIWHDSGARDLANWLSYRYGISYWKASRWIKAAHALEHLPLTSQAFRCGELGVDKVTELTRFATPQTESRLVRWAQTVNPSAIRNKGDLMAAQALEDVRQIDRDRSLSWWTYDEGRRVRLAADLPAAEGAVVTRALDRLARTVPVMPEEDDPVYVEARRADALVAMASVRVAADPDPDRATVVVHAQLDTLVSGASGARVGDPLGLSGAERETASRRGVERNAQIEAGPVIHAETARRLACWARIQMVLEQPSGDPVGMGRISRDPSAPMMRQLRYRDRGCVFPGCGTRRFIDAHHIVWWKHGGRTDLENLVLLCHVHHKLVHEYAWRLTRAPDGTITWFRRDGSRYRAGPAPPRESNATQPRLEGRDGLFDVAV
jgi:hypothetical protein